MTTTGLSLKLVEWLAKMHWEDNDGMVTIRSCTQPWRQRIIRTIGNDYDDFKRWSRGPSSHLSTRPNISESHSEISTRVPYCITGVVRPGDGANVGSPRWLS